MYAFTADLIIKKEEKVLLEFPIGTWTCHFTPKLASSQKSWSELSGFLSNRFPKSENWVILAIDSFSPPTLDTQLITTYC